MYGHFGKRVMEGLADDPLALARALRKIEARSREVPLASGTPATAHLFIVNPSSAGARLTLFSTHPSTDERVARLMAMAETPLRFAAWR
jgi:heat shock protein HtpX